MLDPRKAAAIGFSCAALSACVTDPKVEDYVPAKAGAHQPAADGVATLGAADACKQLTDAERAARDKLGCDARAELVCPGYLAVAGALPCGLYDKSTVVACVSDIEGYKSCSDFDTKPCIVTAVVSSCHAAPVAEAGTDGSVPKDGAIPDGGSPDTSVGPGDGGGAKDAALPDAVADTGPG